MTAIENFKNAFVLRRLGTRLIPQNLATSEQMALFSIEPPTNGFRENQLLSSDTTTITGEGKDIGFSTTTMMLDRAYRVKTNTILPVTVRVENSRDPEQDLIRAFASSLLVSILSQPYLIDEFHNMYEEANRIIIRNVPNYQNILDIASKYGSPKAISMIHPALATLPNPSSENHINNSKTIAKLRSASSKSRPNENSLKTTINSMFLYKSPTFLLDASGKTQSRQLNDLTSKVLTAGAGISLKILGPNELVRGIHSGKTATISWGKDSLQDLAKHSICEASHGKFDTLRALSPPELRGANVSPEDKMINRMIERNRVTPELLITVINRLLWETAKSGQKMTRDLFDRQLEKI